MNFLQKLRAASGSKKLNRQLLGQYEAKRTALLTVFRKLAEAEVGVEGPRSAQIAAYAANLLTSEPHSPHLLAVISEPDRDLASTLAQVALQHEMLTAAAAQAARWLAVAHFQSNFDVKTKSLNPESADFILTLARRATELAPEESHCFATLAQVYTTLQNNEAAYSAATRAVELDPNNPEALRILSNATICAGRYDEAEVLLHRARKLRPSLQGYDEALAIIRDVRAGRCDPLEASWRARSL